jgi:hypothetical protein
MNTNLPDSINQIFAQVKSITGKEVQLVEKKDLSTYASIKIARKSMPVHVMYFKPGQAGIMNHLIAHECGHILRIFEAEPEHRLVPFHNDQFKMKALKDIEPEIQRLSKMIPFDRLVQIANIWYTGMIKQLTNFPSDIMIEQWIYDKYPDLRPYQTQNLVKQYDEAVQALAGQVEKLTPVKILKASNGMNYAFFNTLGVYFNNPYFMKRYDKSNYVDIGNQLILLQKESENSYIGDVDTVNKWASVLQMFDWFDWRDFEDIPANYLDTFV